jgi:hypothetical protein
LGTTEIHNRYIELFPYKKINGKKEAYFIYSNKDLPNIVFIGGNSNQSINYGVSTLLQLISDSTNHLYVANIVDYPTFDIRGITVGYVPDSNRMKLDTNLQFFYKYKLNHVLFDGEKSILEQKKTNSDLVSWFLKRQTSAILKSSVLINPFLEEKLAKNKNLKSFTCYNLSIPPAGNAYLSNYLKSGISSAYISFGASNNFLLEQCIEENIENWDILESVNNHKNYISSLNQYFKKQHPNIELKIIPSGLDEETFFNDKANMDIYYEKVFPLIAEKSQFVWAGKNAYCPVIDYADYFRLADYFEAYPEIIYSDIQTETILNQFENPHHLFVGNKRLYSLFSPCELDYLTIGHRFEGNNQINFNLEMQSAIERIKLLTYLDFAWNPQAYKPTQSIWRVLNAQFGEEAALAIIDFNDVFVNLLELLNTPLSTANITKINRSGTKIVEELETSFSFLIESADLPIDLLDELRQKKNLIISTFNQKITGAEQQFFAAADSL